MNFRVPKDVHFECQRCARCCGDTSHRGRNIFLLDEEVERISKYTGLRPSSFSSPAFSNGYYHYKMKKRSGRCVFLDRKSCSIYEVRPLICQFYPFSLRKKNGAYTFEVATDCAGVGLGELVTREDYEKMIEKATKFFDADAG
jgi:Fe-S-cluster containining protein